MKSLNFKIIFTYLLFAMISVSSYATKLIAIYTYQSNGTSKVTVLHQLSSIDSLTYDGTNMNIYKGHVSTAPYIKYAIAKVDSIKYLDGYAWTDTLIPALDVTSMGVVADGTTNNKSKLNTAATEARNTKQLLYFKNGTYLSSGNLNFFNVKVVGQSKTGVVLKDGSTLYEHNLDYAENMTFQDAFISDYPDPAVNGGAGVDLRSFYNCVFKTTKSGYTQTVYSGMYNIRAAVEFINCDFENLSTQYTGLLLRKFKSVLIKNCLFAESGHPLYFQAGLPNAKIEVIGNTVNGGTTGIFFQGNKDMPFVGALIKDNTVNNVMEEGIAIDGIGNDKGLIPVICNGTMGAITNNTLGQPVVNVAAMIDSYSRDSIMNIVGEIGDLKNYYFSFGRATGLEGKVIKIADYSVANQTVTLDTVLLASAITSGGFGGIQGGFFNFHIIGNSLNNILGTNNAYGTAISAYLNSFGFLIENNTVTNCAHGINVAGGLMLTVTHSLAYNNTVRNNTFIDCDKLAGAGAPTTEKGTVRFLSYYADPTTGPFQYNNSFTGNSVNYGGLYIQNQQNMIFQNNTLDTANTIYLESNSNVIK